MSGLGCGGECKFLAASYGLDDEVLIVAANYSPIMQLINLIEPLSVLIDMFLQTCEKNCYS